MSRGLAAVPAERRREIARKGGLTVHARGTAYKFTSEVASKAGKIGGASPRRPYTRRKKVQQ